ncbi:MAG: protein-glutamate O-methyltransferase CheR [Eubacteriales bacterium]|nr:protein-glutamate O-methyltransferase CheR [Eubacteriales bacterium]
MAYDYDSFKSDVLKLTGIDLNLYKERQMKRRIESLIVRKGYDGFDSFYKGMKQDENLLRTFVSYLTINVSQFYRNPTQWKIFESDILPYLCKQFHNKVSIWSAACSTGDEPYTLAMICAKYIPLENIHIIATDIDDDVLRFARQGIYSSKSLVDLPKEFLQKWFTAYDENRYIIDDKIKKCISFKKHNLLADPYYNGLNLIVCRNVVIYFTDEAKIQIYKQFEQSLDRQGILFIGSTEQILKPKEYGFESFATFFYKKD